MITPGADNFSEHAAGGMTGLALGVADANARESGLNAIRNTPVYDPNMQDHNNVPGQGPGTFDPRGGSPYVDHRDLYQESPSTRPNLPLQPSVTSLTPLGPAAFPPGIATPQSRSTVSRSPQSFQHEPYVDNPYQRHSRNLDPNLVDFDPNTIEDDGDDGLEYRAHNANRSSMLSLGYDSSRNASVVGGAAAAGGGVLGALGGLVGKRATPNSSNPQYDPVHDVYGGASNYDLGPSSPSGPEKAGWLAQQKKHHRKWKLIIIFVFGFLILGGVAGGIAGGVVSSRKDSNSSAAVPGQSASSDTSSNGDLNAKSAEIKALMDNPGLHKVFPGIDYTPMYTQYPDCLSYPPSQNNVTRDLAVLSQLTNTIRLYGTDCNQTEMLLHSIDQLNLNGTIKVWMGVWLDTNTTTNERQLSQMYDIFNKHGAASFVGVIVGNEVLYRQDMNATALGDIITGVRSNLTSMGISIPVASSDLGDDWTSALADVVDIVMANIHPFFAGVTADVAASWTWEFWQNHDITLQSDTSKNYISETGWPSQGGTDCGGAASCVNGELFLFA